MKFALTFCFVLFAQLLVAQDLKLQRMDKPGKTYTIEADQMCDFELKDVQLSNGERVSRILIGKLDAVTPDSLTIVVHSEHVATGPPDWNRKVAQLTYAVEGVEPEKVTIAKNDLARILVWRSWTDIAGGIFFAGAATAVLVAPSVALDYDGTDFDQRTYLRVIGLGFGAMVLGTIVGVAGGTKAFVLEDHGNRKQKWQVIAD